MMAGSVCSTCMLTSSTLNARKPAVLWLRAMRLLEGLIPLHATDVLSQHDCTERTSTAPFPPEVEMFCRRLQGACCVCHACESPGLTTMLCCAGAVVQPGHVAARAGGIHGGHRQRGRQRVLGGPPRRHRAPAFRQPPAGDPPGTQGAQTAGPLRRGTDCGSLDQFQHAWCQFFVSHSNFVASPWLVTFLRHVIVCRGSYSAVHIFAAGMYTRCMSS